MVAVETEKKAILDMMAEYVKAVNNKDLNGSLEIWDEDSVFLAPGGPIIKGMEDWTNFLKAAHSIDATMDLDILHVDVSESRDMAYVYNTVRQVIRTGDGETVIHSKALGVFKKRNGEWKVIALCSNYDAPPE